MTIRMLTGLRPDIRDRDRLRGADVTRDTEA
jgi:hypothetical protein